MPLTSTAREYVHALEFSVLLAEHRRATANGAAVCRPRQREDDVGPREGRDSDPMMAFGRVERHLIRIELLDQAHDIGLTWILDCDAHG